MKFKILTLLLFFNLSQCKSEKNIRVYVDMVADLFHYGHVNFLKQAKELGGPNSKLIVGICNDEDVSGYKRKPILSMKERVKSVSGCKYVDEVIKNAPLIVTEEIITKYKIDLVVHGDDFDKAKLEKYYSVPIKMGIFKTVPYTPSISTTEILERVKAHLAIKS